MTYALVTSRSQATQVRLPPKKGAGDIEVVGGRDALAIEVRLPPITSLGVKSTLYYLLRSILQP